MKAANALVAGAPRQSWKLGKSGSSRGQGQSCVELALVDKKFGAGWCVDGWMWVDLVLISWGLVLSGMTAPCVCVRVHSIMGG